ncbi:hypothetical protein [Streptomyces antarcticus]|uniref:hypothetical protein n=1 Tax=Streptomyces antarcticus TaxID=2996458 RepID=UPI00226E8640|nr:MULTISPECIES: hypothetical protein [unclassified Streptomyces]MCY0942348.1 hypothetical protein [Streptomyces sp. H34-AA3]MCZ4080655.1 hypothetical protein [Streptomyces sp. H34-S5]
MSSEITLYTSSYGHIVALVSGESFRWARTALQLAGFEKDSDGNYVVPLIDTARARQALAALTETSRSCQSTVTAADQRYIGDFALGVSRHLPGQWKVRVENYAHPAAQGDLFSCLWTTGSNLRYLENRRIPAAAVIQAEDGAEIAIVYNPRHRVYDVGMLVPTDMYLDESVTPPPMITVHPATVPAARKIASTLLTDYHRALFEMQLNHLGDDLAWAQEEFEPGTVQDPPQRDLAEAFERFASIAPHIITALRTSDAHAVNAHEQAFLEDMGAAFSQPGAGAEEAGETRENPSLDLLSMWMSEGEGLVELARDAVRTAPAQTALGLVRAVGAPGALPSPPPRVGAALNRR